MTKHLLKSYSLKQALRLYNENILCRLGLY